MRTGKSLRQLVSAPTGAGNTQSRGSHSVVTECAHQAEIKDIAVSKDGMQLVSASADHTLKIWDMEAEKQSNTLVGHTDEVCNHCQKYLWNICMFLHKVTWVNLVL